MNQNSSTHSQDTTVPLTGLTPLRGENELQHSIDGHAIFRDNPFAQVGNYTEIQYQEGASVEELVNFVCINNSWLKNYIIVKIGTDYIPKEQWARVKLKRNAPVQILVVPQGGGGGKNVLKIVALITIAIYAPQIAASMGFTTTTAGVTALTTTGQFVAAGIALVGALAVNAIFPPPKLPNISGLGTGLSDSAVFGFSQVKNVTKPYSPIPRVYGRNKVVPNYAAKPFIQSIGDQQWIYLLFDFGYGPLQLTDLKIGENAIGTYTGIDYIIHDSFGPASTLSIYNKDVEQDAYSLKLLDATYRTVTTTADTTELVLDFQFPSGLNKVNTSTGDVGNFTTSFSVEVRAVGTSTWNPYTSYSYSLTSEYASVSGTKGISCTAATAKPFFVSLTLLYLAANQYEIRVIRTTATPTTKYTYSDVYLAALRSIKSSSPISVKETHTIVEMKILATEQLNGVVDEFSAIATSFLPTWNGTDWVYQTTRNPAWIYADILRGSASPNPIDDSRIDKTALLEWANWCDAPAANEPTKPKSQCDFIINGQSTAWQALKLVAATGDASPTVRSGKYSVTIDKVKSTPVQLFTPRNCLSFSANRMFHDQPDALRVQFVDPEEQWLPREIVVYDDGKNSSNSTKFEVLELTGITNYHQAWRIGRRALAQGRLRQEIYTITTGVENLLATRGDLVRLSYDVPKIGKGWGRISNISGQNITLDEKFTTISIGDYIRVRKNSDVQSDFAVTAVIDQYTVTVSGSLSSVAVGNLCVYGPVAQMSLDCLVKSVTPLSDLKASIELVPYAPAIYTAETDPIPAYNPLISTVNDLVPGEVGNLQASQYVTFINRYPYIAIALSWIGSPPGKIAVNYEVYQKQNGVWVIIGTTQDRFFYAYQNVRLVDESGNVVNLIGKLLEFSVVGVASNGTRIQPDQGAKVSITPTKDDVPPSAPTYLDIDLKNSSQLTLEWGHPNNNDIDGYEIRYSPLFSSLATFQTSTIAAEKVSYPSNNVTISARFGTYLIKTIDTSGNYSETAAISITPTNTLFDYKFLQTVQNTTWSGTKDGMEVFDSTKIRTSSTGAVGEYNQDGYYYFTDTIDFGSIYPVRITSSIDAYGFTLTEAISSNTGWDAWLEVRTGTDIETLSDWGTLSTITSLSYGEGDFNEWRTFHAGDFTGYLLQFRLRTRSNSPTIGVAVKSASIEINAQKRVDGDYDVVSSIGGSRVNYDAEFQQRPAISITQDSVQAGDRYTLTNQNLEGFDIEFFNSSGTSVSRQFDWVASGIGRKVISIPS
jgi:hypothetical protein